MGADGDSLWRHAQRLCAPSVLALRLKPDWERAAPLFMQAASAFAKSKDHGRARLAYEKAAQGYERTGCASDGAKALEQAAVMACSSGQLAKSGQLYDRAAQLQQHASSSLAADTLIKGAARLEQAGGVQEGIKMLRDATMVLSDAEGAMHAGDAFQAAVAAQLRLGAYADAASTYVKYAAYCEAMQLHSTQCKAYLATIIIFLHQKEMTQAWASYQDALEVSTFASCEQAVAAEALFQAYALADIKAIRNVIQSHWCCRNLDNQVVKLALSLPEGAPLNLLAAEAQQLRGLCEEELCDDLT